MYLTIKVFFGEDIQGILLYVKVVYTLLRNCYKTALLFFSAEGICVCVQVRVCVLEEEQKKKTFHEDSY